MSNKNLKNPIVIVVFIAICGLAALANPDLTRFPNAGAWYSVVPPLLAVCLALLVNQLIAALGLAILVGGFLAETPKNPTTFSGWWDGLKAGPTYIFNSFTDPTNLQIIAFVVLILAMISVIIVAGGLQGVVRWLAKYARGPKSAQVVTALMGLAVFIDDYANTMIVGSSMRSLTDEYKVSREKLAFLVDATSAPIAGIAIVSTWIGYEVGLFSKVSESLGIGVDGYSLFFDALAFRFYCIFMIFFVFYNVLTGKDFGPMKKAEERSRKLGQVEAPDAVPMTSKTFSHLSTNPDADVRGLTAIIPIAVLFIFLLGSMWTDGGGNAHIAQKGFLTFFSFTTWREVMAAGENGILILAQSAALGLGVAFVCAYFFSKLHFSLLLRAAVAGIKGSLLPVMILGLAWSLKATCDALSTGPFLVAAVGDVMSPTFFPLILFIVAGLTAFATGTSWGTMAILIPTAIPIAFQLDGGVYGLTTMICLGAVLDGAIFGDHCSPISDTTVMSSIASSCDHIHHVKTQLPYALTAATVAAFCGYIPAALGLPSGLAILLGVLVMGGLFFGVLKKSTYSV